jgi:hypothetical protein
MGDEEPQAGFRSTVQGSGFGRLGEQADYCPPFSGLWSLVSGSALAQCIGGIRETRRARSLGVGGSAVKFRGRISFEHEHEQEKER